MEAIAAAPIKEETDRTYFGGKYRHISDIGAGRFGMVRLVERVSDGVYR